MSSGLASRGMKAGESEAGSAEAVVVGWASIDAILGIVCCVDVNGLLGLEWMVSGSDVYASWSRRACL